MFGKKKDEPAHCLSTGAAIREQQEVNTAYQKGVTALRDFIAPSSLEFKSKFFQLGTRYAALIMFTAIPPALYRLAVQHGQPRRSD
jgi:hypothetical protein